jgi:hypothetical protein
MMKSCKEIENLRDDYLNGDLSEEQSEAFKAHLGMCVRCKRKTAVEEDLSFMLTALPRYTPSESLVRKTEKKISLFHRTNRFAAFSYLLEHEHQLFNWGVALALGLLVALNLNFYFAKQPTVTFQSAPAVVLKQDTLDNYQPVKFVLNVEARKLENVKTVSVAGDFNGWNATADKMKYDEKVGAWVLDLKLKSGMYDYMYVINDKVWIADPQADKQRDDGFGGKNSVLKI